MPAIPPKPKSVHDDRNLVTVDGSYAAPGPEDKLRLYWEKNSKLILAGIAAIALFIIIRGASRYISEQHEVAVETDYANATNESQLKTFIAGHSGDVLAGLAQLKLADRAYSSGQYQDAQTSYSQAWQMLKGTPAAASIAARAQLGAAVSLMQGGKTAEATTALTQLANDSGQPKAARTEATYDLAVQAVAAGHIDEVAGLAKQIMAIDATSPFVERVHDLQTRPPIPAQAAGAATMSAPSLPTPGSGPATQPKADPTPASSVPMLPAP